MNRIHCIILQCDSLSSQGTAQVKGLGGRITVMRVIVMFIFVVVWRRRHGRGVGGVGGERGREPLFPFPKSHFFILNIFGRCVCVVVLQSSFSFYLWDRFPSTAIAIVLVIHVIEMQVFRRSWRNHMPHHLMAAVMVAVVMDARQSQSQSFFLLLFVLSELLFPLSFGTEFLHPP